MMATRAKSTRTDENKLEKIKKLPNVKKVGAPTEVKRAALGELGNRAIIKNGNQKDGQVIKNGNQKDGIKESKPVLNIKNAKPRVDTHWKKIPVPPKPVIKNLPSETSARITSGKSSVIKTATTTVKSVSNEKVGTKASQKLEEKELKIIEQKDNNLSRQSLSKLKAVISRNLKEKPRDSNAKVEIKIVTVQAHSEKLLSEVENIDINDSENPLLVSEYVNDIYSYLYHLEVEFPIDEDHLKNQVEVTPRMRSVLIDWLNEVHYQFHLMAETFHMTVGIIDRYLQAVPDTSRQNLQLVGVTALFIASKYEELYPPEVCDFVYITDDTYNKAQIFAMERKIVKTLKFELSRPCSIHFLRRYSKAAKVTNSHHLMSKYFIELAAIEYSFSHIRPSEVAAASLYLSLLLLKESDISVEKLWTATLQYYSRYTVEHLKPIVKKIAQIVKNASTARLKAVYNKYQSSKFERISTRPELTGPIIETLCAE